MIALPLLKIIAIFLNFHSFFWDPSLFNMASGANGITVFSLG